MRGKAIARFLSIIGGGVLSVAPASVYASDLNLTTAGATATATANIGGSFTVTQISPQSTGTGVIDSFLRVQSNGSATSEQGYNTNLGTPMDDKGGGFTRALTLAEVPTVDLNSTPGNLTDDYYQFLLDINQVNSGTNNLLSLNQIQIFTATSDQLASGNADATSTTAASVSFASATERFRMSSTATNAFTRILLDYSLNSGSGSGDMFLYVAKSAFAGAALTNNVILFTQFGIPNGSGTFGTGTNDGFEEWAVLKTNLNQCVTCNLEETPEPASLMLLGSGLAFAAARFRRKVARQA